jgi:hypothetical protein
MARQVRGPGRGVVLAAVGWGCWLLIPAFALAESPGSSRWVAEDAAIYLEVARPAELLDRIHGESFQKLLGAIPAYARYLKSDDYRKARAVVDFVADKLDTTWDKGLRDLAGGGMVFAVEGEPGKPPRVILSVTPRDAAFLTRATSTLLDLARKDASDKGRPDPVKTAEYRGVTGYALEKGAFAVVEGTLLITDHADTLKAVVNRALDGPTAGRPISESAEWKARRAKVPPDALAWGVVRLDRLRALDPKKFSLPEQEKTPPQATFLFGSWVEALRKAPWASASLSWTESRLGAELTVPVPPGGYADALKGFLPLNGSCAPAPLSPPGTIASVSLWRDLSALWEARAELLPPQAVQNLAKLDTFAGQFFGGRDFGSGVLGALSSRWKLVIARQNYSDMKPPPDVKLPAFALVIDLKPDDEDFAQRLKVAFQSFVGLSNLDAAQKKAPPLELGSETVDGVTVATTRYIPPKTPPAEKEPVHQRHNFSPSAAQVGDHFILSSSLGLTRDLIKALRAPEKPAEATLVAEADGSELAKLVEINRKRLVMQNMLEKGYDKARAEEEVGTLTEVLRYAGHGRLSVRDGTESVRLAVDFALGR